MAINIVKYDLLPVRRDKQVGSGVVSSGGSYSSGGDSGGSVDLTGYITESSLNIGVPPTMADFFWNVGKLEVNFPTSLSGFIKETSLGSHFKWTSGLLNVSDYISKTQVDASLNNTWNIASYVNTSSYYDSSLNLRLKDTSLNMTKFKWVSGLLEPSVGTGTGDVTKLYVDGSLAQRDASLNNVWSIQSYVNSSSYYDSSLNARSNKIAPILYKTTAYTLTSTDNNCIIEASGNFSIYLPTNLDTGFQAIIVNVGGGTISLNASTGATYFARDSSNDLTKRYSGATVYKRNSTEWVAMGDLN